MTTEAVLFDLDGTLVDFKSAWRAGIDAAFATILKRHSDLSLTDVEAAWDETWVNAQFSLRQGHKTMAAIRAERFPGCLERLGIEDAAFCDEVNFLLGSTMLDHLRPFDDVAVLESLRDTWQLGIVTNGADDSHPDSQRSKIERTRLGDHVDQVFISDSCGFAKPDPRLLTHSAEQLGVTPSGTLFVGDSPEIDIAAANHAGMTSVLIWREPGPPPELSGALRPRIVIHSLKELSRWIDFS